LIREGGVSKFKLDFFGFSYIFSIVKFLTLLIWFKTNLFNYLIYKFNYWDLIILYYFNKNLIFITINLKELRYLSYIPFIIFN
jgi:hypothetical protein